MGLNQFSTQYVEMDMKATTTKAEMTVHII